MHERRRESCRTHEHLREHVCPNAHHVPAMNSQGVDEAPELGACGCIVAAGEAAAGAERGPDAKLFVTVHTLLQGYRDAAAVGNG